jgi:glycosyltransferase involved in cell wall biosynthesis
MCKKKILFISDRFYPDVGGIEIIAEVLSVAFLDAGYQVHLITRSSDSVDKVFPNMIIRNPDIITLLKEHNWADLVFENNPALKLSWPNLFFRKPLITVIHTWINRLNGTLSWQDKLKLWWLKRAKKVIAVSKAIKVKTFKDAVIIHNPYRNELFRELEYVKRDQNFVFLGRLVSDKGADLAIEALRMILDNQNLHFDRKKMLFTIIGDGPEKKKLENLVSKHQLEKNIVFAGQLTGEELVQVLNQHKFLLVPSRWEEPFGLVALEAMACGCIPIVSNGGGLPEAVGKAGIVFERGNVEALAEAMGLIINDQKLQHDLKKEAVPHLKNHSSQLVLGKYLTVIQNILN